MVTFGLFMNKDMGNFVNINNNWKTVNSCYCKVNGVWRKVNKACKNINGTWKCTSYGSQGIDPSNPEIGVYIYANDGLLYTSDSWNTSNNANAVGIAVVTNECKFVIDKSNESNLKWSDEARQIPKCTNFDDSFDSEYMEDYNGVNNTNAIIKYYPSTQYAAAYCNSCSYTINNIVKKGYLGSISEWSKTILYFNDIVSLMTKIGGEELIISEQNGGSAGVINFNAYWSSTQSWNSRFNQKQAFYCSFYSNHPSYYYSGPMAQSRPVRPFYEL